ncbi:hypothetical protein [Kitasatospora indigofera]|uniref:hypothetical protein n=1 Tax=Kitasatospora indigofera TaxID=67307 RepID=UPI0033B1BC4E
MSMMQSDGRSTFQSDGSVARRTHRGIRVATALLTATLLTVGTAACSSSSSSSSPATSASATPSGTAPADPAAAEATVKQNWEKFFNPSTSLDDRTALLQNGEQLKPLLQTVVENPQGGQAQAQVGNVTFTSPTTADVTYTLSIQGNVVQADAKGKAVLVDGTWKVSTTTFCGLVTQGGTVTGLAGCS